MLHYAPELVHMDRMTYRDVVEPKPYVRYPVRDGDVPAYGGLADPAAQVRNAADSSRNHA